MVPSLTYRKILAFWLPLAGTWLMMSIEGPFLAAVIARLPAPTENLAAYGVAFAFALILESPVIMLLSASTALVRDRDSYLALRRYAYILNAVLTGALLLVLLPSVFDTVSLRLLNLPPRVAELTHVALALLLPWPAAIGYRRFHQGVLVRHDMTRRVAYGTVLRLASMAAAAVVAASFFDLAGAWVGALALSAGVVVEGIASRLMAWGLEAELLSGARDRLDAASSPDPMRGGPPAGDSMTLGGEKMAGDVETPGAVTTPDETSAFGDATGPDEPNAASGATPADATAPGGATSLGSASAIQRSQGLGLVEINRFYVPLALTSMLAMAVHPMVTFFLGQARFPLESLAVWPVIVSFTFMFRSAGLSFQEVAIALMGERGEHFDRLRRFATGLGLAASAGQTIVAFSPLALLWFHHISGLSLELTAFALPPTRVLAAVPALSVMLSFQRALLVNARRTAYVTVATAIEVLGIAALLAIGILGLDLYGALAAAVALLLGRAAGNVYLVPPCLGALRRLRLYR